MSSYVLIPLIALLFNMFLLFLVLRRDHRNSLHRIFSLFLIALGVWAFAVFALRSSSTLESAFFWQKICLLAGALGAVLFYHFALLFTHTRPRKGILPGAYLLSIALLLLVPADLIIGGAQINSYGPAPIPGPLFLVYILYEYAFAMLALLTLLKAYRSSTSHEERNRIGYIVAGMVCFFLGGISDILPTARLPGYPLGMVATILFCSFATIAIIAILRYRLLDIQIVIRKGLAYSLISGLIIGLYFGAILLVNHVFRAREISLAANLSLVLLVAIALQPVLRRAQGLVDRWFYRERYDHLKALGQFSQETKSIMDLRHLSSSLIRVVTLAMQTDKACLLLPSSATGRSTTASRQVWHNPHLLTLPDNHPIIRWLSGNEGFLSRQDVGVLPQLKGLAKRETLTLKGAEIELYIPVKTQRGLVGVLVLGPKLSDQPYSSQDLEVLLTVTNQVAISIENAWLYGQLKQQLEELRQTRAQLMCSAKLASIGELAANIAHEINNPLQGVLNYSFLLSQRMGESDHEKTDLEALENEALRAQSIARSLLDFARRDEPKKERVQINEILQSLIPLAKLRTEADGIALVEDYTPDMPEIEADPDQLKQVFLNLITNALDAMPDGGKLAIVTRSDVGQVTSLFSDTGKGIPPESLLKIFAPFFTTKPKGKGTGLGLAVSLGIVENHGGTIAVQSEEGKGSTFAVTLPTPSTREAVHTHA